MVVLGFAAYTHTYSDRLRCVRSVPDQTNLGRVFPENPASVGFSFFNVPARLSLLPHYL